MGLSGAGRADNLIASAGRRVDLRCMSEPGFDDNASPSLSGGAFAREMLTLIAVVAVLVVMARVGPGRALAGPAIDRPGLSEPAAHVVDECLNPRRVVPYNKPRG